MEKIICPNTNCNYRGKPIKSPRGYFIIGCLLLLPGIFPGIFYFMFFNGYRYSCPSCGLQILNEN